MKTLTVEDVQREVRELAARRPDERSFLEYGPVSAEQIEKREAQLGDRFPLDYRLYLEAFAGGMLHGYEIFGVPTPKSVFPWTDPSGMDDEEMRHHSIVTDVAWTNRDRRRFGERRLLQFSHDGGDYEFVLDLGALNADGEAPVCLWGPGNPGVIVAPTFLGFFRRIANRENVYEPLDKPRYRDRRR